MFLTLAQVERRSTNMLKPAFDPAFIEFKISFSISIAFSRVRLRLICNAAKIEHVHKMEEIFGDNSIPVLNWYTPWILDDTNKQAAIENDKRCDGPSQPVHLVLIL